MHAVSEHHFHFKMFLKIANTVYGSNDFIQIRKGFQFPKNPKLKHFAFCFDINAPVFNGMPELEEGRYLCTPCTLLAQQQQRFPLCPFSVDLILDKQFVVLFEGRLIPRSAVGTAGIGSHGTQYTKGGTPACK